MSTVKKGTFELNLGFVKLGADLDEEDRQCAWELYTEITTRVAVCGKRGDPECTNFDGELYVESLDSLHRFFQEARLIMRRFPVGKLKGLGQNEAHLGVLISRIMAHVLRPFLEKWQVKYRHWWEHESNPRLAPLARQAEFAQVDKFLADWAAVRCIMRAVRDELVQAYDLVNVEPK